MVVFCLCFFLLGANYFHYTLYNIPKTIEGEFEGVVREPPSVRGDFTRVTVDYEKGGVLLYVDRYSDIKYGEVLKVEGDFHVPEEESYTNYLKKEGIYHVGFRPSLEKVGSEGSILKEKLFLLRERMKENMQRAITFPQILLLEAMILGDRDSFSSDFNEKLNVSGTRHITAISGMHIIIISSVLFYLFILLGVRKRRAALFSLFLVALFVFFVGAPASALRAGIMGGVVLSSYIVYRKTSSIHLLVLTATGMLIFNPLLLHYDLGFQLSFLAVIGILLLHQKVKRFILEKVKVFDKLADLLAVTISAQIFVFPLILYNFGHISLYSIPANILIVPTLPFIMILGFLTALTGFVVFAFPVYLLLSFVLIVIDFIYSLPFSAIYIENVPFYFVVFFYIWIFSKIFNTQE